MAKQLNVNLAFNADIGKAKASIQELQSLLNKVATMSPTASTSGMTQQIETASNAAKELQIHLNNAFNTKTGQFDLSALDKSLKASGSNIQDLSIKLINAGETGQQAFMKLAQSISMADQPMLRINSKLREFATTMKNTVRWQLSSSMLHGFMGAIQGAYGYAQDLNESLTNIRIVTGQSTEEMVKFAENANKAAKTLNTTTTDYTNASLIYFQQGLSEEEVAARTEVTVKMANAAGQSASVVSDQLTAIWNNFYDGSKSLEYYADVMTALGAATASSTDEIAGGLEKFAAIGETIGLSYEYAASALATITSNTRQSEEVVGTALKTIFARIQGLKLGETLDDGTSLNKYSEALQKVGISIFDSTGELKNMDNILDEMGAKWETLNKSQQVALAQTVAGTRQYTQLVALMDNWDNGDNDSMIANLETSYGATGALQEQADIYAESWEAASKRVRASAEGIYQSLLDDKFFIQLNNGIAELLGGIDLFIDKAGGLKSILIAISSILLSTYSSKIPVALQNLSHNFTIVKNNLLSMADLSGKLKIPDQYADTLQKMQKATNHMFDVQGVDKNSSLGFMVTSSNELAVARSKLSSVSDKMTESERQLADLELQMAQSYQEEIYTLKQKNEELEKSIKLQAEALQSENPGAGFTSKAYKQEEAMANRYTAMQRDPEADAGDQNALGQFKLAYSSVIDEIDTSIGEIGNKLLTEFMRAGDGIEAESQSISSELGKVANAAQTIQKNLGDLSLDEGKKEIADLRDTIPEAVREASGLEKIFRDIATATTKEDFDSGVNNLVASLQNCEIPASKIKQVLKGLYGDSKIDKLDKDMKKLKSNTEQAEKKMSQLKNTLNGFAPTHVVRTSEALGSLASLAGGAVTMVNLLSSAIRSLADPEASGWEKLSAVLMVIATGIPTVTMGFRSVGTILGYLNQQFATLGMVTATSTQAQRESALAATLSSTSHGILAKKLTEEQIAKIASIAMTEKENGATKEQIALKVQEYLVTNNIKTGKAAEVISRLAARKAIEQENTSLREGIIAKGLDSAAMLIQNGHRTTGIILQTILNALTGDWVSILKVVLAVIALLVGGAFIAWLEKVIVTEKESMQMLEERAERSKKAFEDVRNSIQETVDTLKSIDEQRSAIDNMTEGTVEWYTAVSKLNAEVLLLVEKFPFLKEFITQTNGILSITEDGLKALEEYQQQRYFAANNLMISDTIAKEQGQINSTMKDIRSGYTFSSNTGRIIADAYKNPMIGEQIFTREGSNALLDTLLEAENSGLEELLDHSGFTVDEIRENSELYRQYSEQFYQDILDNKDNILEVVNTEQYMQELENSQMANVLKMIGSNRSVDEVNEMLGQDYSDIRGTKRNEIATSFGDWNDHIDYDENSAEWEMIQDFMKTKGDNVEYVGQSWGEMVIKIDGEEFKYSKDEVYDALAELYTTDEIKTRLCDSLTETLGESLTGVNLDQLDTSQIFQLDNLVMDFENALSNSGFADQADTIMNKIIASTGGTEGLEDFLLTMSNIDLSSNAKNLREFNNATLQLAEGTMSVEEFTHAMEKMSAAAQLDSMDSYFSGMAEKFGMSEEDAQSMQNYASHIMEIAETSKEFSDELATNADSAAELAVEITRMNNGVDKLAKGFKNWNEVLKKSSRESKEYAEALGGIKDALADILDVNKDLLSESFVTDNLPLIEEASKGSAEAIDELIAKMDEEIILNITTGQTEQFINEVTAANDLLQGLEWPDIEVGAILNDQQFLDAANNLVSTAGMTADEANAYFAGIGYEPVYNEEEIPTETKVPNATTTMKVSNIGWNDAKIDIFGTEHTISLPNITYTTESTPLDPTPAEGSMRLVSFSGDGTAPPIRGLRKKASGSSNNYSSSNAGGNSSSGGGGGGSSGSATKKSKSDVVDRYKEVNDQLEETASLMNKNSKIADSLWGPAKFDAMKKGVELMKQENELLKDKLSLAKDYLAEDTDALFQAAADAGVSLEIDADTGLITNYTEEMNALVERYNQMVEAANDDGQVTEAEQDELDDMDERINALKDAVSQYDETIGDMRDLEEDILENDLAIMSENFSILQDQLELEITINDSQMKNVDYFLSLIEDDLYSTAEAYALMSQQAKIYGDNLQDQEAFLAEVTRQYEAGEISQADYKQSILDVQDATIENLENLEATKEAMQDFYGNALNTAVEKVYEYTDSLEQLNSVLDHYSSILSLVGKQEDYATKNKILDGKATNLKNQIDVQSEMYKNASADADKWYQKMSEAVEGSNEYETYRKNWLAAKEIADTAQEEMLAKTEEWAQTMKEIIQNELAEAAKSMEESLTGGKSFDELLTSMERSKSLQEEYLTTTNKIYETNKLMNKAQQDIDKSTNTIAKNKLKNFIKETDNLQKKNKLSKFELEIQQAKYDLLLAEIALQETQNAKSNVTLQRDSEGNYGYVYTANQEDIAAAQQQVEDAQNALYNIGLEGANDYAEKYVQLMSQCQDEITELTQMWMNGEIATEEEYNRRRAEIESYYYEQLKTYSNLYQVALGVDTNIIKDTWTSSYGEMTTKTDEWKTAVSNYFDTSAESFKTWEGVCSTALELSGLEDIGTAVDNVKIKSDDLTQALIGEDGVVGGLWAEAEAAGEVSEAYLAIQNNIDAVILKYREYLDLLEESYQTPTSPTLDDDPSDNERNPDADGSDYNGNTYNPDSDDDGNDDPSDDQPGGDPDPTTPTTFKPVALTAQIPVSKNPKVDGSAGYVTVTKGGGSSYYYQDTPQGDLDYRLNHKGQMYYISWTSYNKLKSVGFDTGGYTGSWGPDGKMAMLHEKELVLNAKDTENFLASMDLLDKIIATIDLYSLNQQFTDRLNSPGLSHIGNDNVLEQKVHIEASFPNVTDHNEIEEAFNNLINTSSQYANRK